MLLCLCSPTPITDDSHPRTSMCIRDIEPIRYSRYIDECCSILVETAEFPTDISVGHLTRLHGLAQKIAHTFTVDELRMPLELTAAPAGACVKALEADLLRLQDSFSDRFHHDGKVVSSEELLS